MDEKNKLNFPPRLKQALWCCAWALLLANIFLRLDFMETPVGATQGYPQPAMFANKLLDLPQDWANWLMPLTSLVYSLADQLPSGLEYLPQALFYLCTALLLFGAGAALKSPFAKLAAPLLFLLFVSSPILDLVISKPSYREDIFYSLLCCLVAYAMLLRGQSKERCLKTELLTAVSIGLSFMVKNPLILLPPALAGWDIISGKLRRGETSWRMILTLCLVPYAMLLPWEYMNWHISNTHEFFQHTRAADNLLSGAMGIVCTTELSHLIAGIPQSDSAMAWAIKTVLHHPLPYISSVLQRIYMEFSWYPALATGFLLAFIKHRNNPTFIQLAFFIAYFVGIHSLLSIQPRYFIAIWPLLILGATTLPNSPAQERPLSITPKAVFLLFFAPLSIAYIFVSYHLLEFPHSAMSATKALTKLEQSEAQPNATILAYAAYSELQAGHTEPAYQHARKALLARHSFETVKAYAYALLARDKDALPVLNQRLLNCDIKPYDCLLLRSADSLVKGNYAEGRSYFYQAFMGYEQVFFFNEYDARQKPELDRIRRLRLPPIWLDAVLSRTPVSFKSEELCAAQKALLRLDQYPQNTKTTTLERILGAHLFLLKLPLDIQTGRPLAKLPALGPLPKLEPPVKQLSEEVAITQRALLINLLLASERKYPGSFAPLKAQAAESLRAEEILQFAEEEVLPRPDTLQLIRIYLRHNKNHQLHVRLVEILLKNGMTHEAAAELALLPEGPDRERLAQRVLGTPQAKRRFEIVDELDRDNDYQQFMEEANAYLEEYPFDKRVRQMLDESKHYKRKPNAPL